MHAPQTDQPHEDNILVRAVAFMMGDHPFWNDWKRGMKVIHAIISPNILGPFVGVLILFLIFVYGVRIILELVFSAQVAYQFIQWFIHDGVGIACLVTAAAIIIPNYLSFAFQEELLLELGPSTPERLLRMANLVNAARRKGYEAMDRKNYVGAIEYFRKAAGQGDAIAQYNIGLIYHHGGGEQLKYAYVPQDYEQARHWYYLAAEHGHEEAKLALSELPAD